MSYTEKHGGYPYLLRWGDPSEADVQAASDFLQTTTFAEQKAWADERTTILYLGDRAFRMVIDRPNDGDESQAVVVAGEFSSGVSPSIIARARIIRDMVNPTATLVLQPNTTFNQPNMNYSRAERARLRRGRLAPVIGRIMVALERCGNPDQTTVFGSSQGGVVALGFGADPNTPSSAVAVIEAPNVTKRNHLAIALDFVGCAKGLNDVILNNFEDRSVSFAQDMLRTTSRAELRKCVMDVSRRDNWAMIGAMSRNSAPQQMGTILGTGGSIAHAWGTADKISTVSDNRNIAELFKAHSRYQSFELAGACHGVTSAYALDGAPARVAYNLIQNPDH